MKDTRVHASGREDSRGHTFPAKVSPPFLKRRVGVFSTRSPHRPNPIGVSLCKVLGHGYCCNVRTTLDFVVHVQGIHSGGAFQGYILPTIDSKWPVFERFAVAIRFYSRQFTCEI